MSLIINRVISLQEKEEYTRLFDFFDTNNDGMITKYELLASRLSWLYWQIN